MKIQLEIQSVVNGFLITDIDTKRMRVCEREWELDSQLRQIVKEARDDELQNDQDSRDCAAAVAADTVAAREAV